MFTYATMTGVAACVTVIVVLPDVTLSDPSALIVTVPPVGTVVGAVKRPTLLIVPVVELPFAMLFTYQVTAVLHVPVQVTFAVSCNVWLMSAVLDCTVHGDEAHVNVIDAIPFAGGVYEVPPPPPPHPAIQNQPRRDKAKKYLRFI